MSVKISTTASAQITNHDITKYVSCKMYNVNDVFLTDLSVLAASWNEARDFGVKVLNVSINNSGGVHNKGATYEIKSDYKIVLIEGYDTGVTNDKFPKFKGYVQDIITSIEGGVPIVNLTIYDELTITKRSDMDKVFSADTTTVTDEDFTAIIDNPLGSIKGNPVGKRTRILYTKNNSVLSGMLHADYFYVGNNMMFNSGITLTPDGSLMNMIFYSGTITGTLSAGDELVNADGSYNATVGTTPLGTYTTTGENVVLLNPTSAVYGNFGDGETLYVQSDTSIYFTAKAFFQVNAVQFDVQTATAASLGIVNNDIVHNGMINGYRAANANWASFKPNKINVRENGVIGEDDLYSGYEVNADKGIIRLNESVQINKFKVTGTYYYYPNGLYVEDVLREVLIDSDSLSINNLLNPYFNQGTSAWNAAYGGGAGASDLDLTVSNGLSINCIDTLTINQTIGVSQVGLTIYSGYTYTVAADIQQVFGTSGNITLTLDSATFSGDAIDYTSNTRLSGTFIPTSSQTGISFIVQVSGATLNDEWKINNLEVSYNPSKINSFTDSNIYCVVSTEDGSASAYTMTTNTDYTILPRYTNLTETITSESTTLKVKSTSEFASTGNVKIDSEYINYTGKTATTFTGLTRGYQSTTQVNHDIGIRSYDLVSASRIWYMQYNNIIPKVSNTTASTYSSTKGVNVGSAASFDITGSTFSEFFYREGILVTSDAKATAVKMAANYDYYFCQLQSTGVETPYILIDYREQKTRYDAINEIRTMLAPNYVVNSTVRLSGTKYVTFIKGRYITQKATGKQDYNLDFIKSIAYKEPNDTYNRVKLFGRSSNPINKMYDANTSVIPANDLNAQLVKGVEYKYIDTNGPWYIFSLFSEKRFVNVDNSLQEMVKRNYDYHNRGSTFVGTYGTKRMDGVAYYLARLNKYHISGGDAVNTSVAGVKLSVGKVNQFWQHRVTVYNSYYVIYDSTSVNYVAGDRLNSNSTIKYIERLDADAPYDSLIFVEHDRDTVVYTGGESLTNGTITSTGYLVTIDGTNASVNYNTNGYTTINVANLYRPVFKSYTASLDLTASNMIDITKFQLYFDGFPNVEEENYGQVTVPLGSVDKYGQYNWKTGWWDWHHNDKYRRGFHGLGVYINKTDGEYASHITPPPGKDLTLGAVRFEKDLGDGDGPTNLLTLKWAEQPCYWYNPGYDGGTLSQQLIAGGFLYFSRNEGMDINNMPDAVRKVIHNATQVRYYKRYKLGLNWEMHGDFLWIDKADMDESNLVPKNTKLTVDGEYVTTLPAEYINSPNKPPIERIRDFTRSGRDEQISLVSRFQIDALPLFVVDLKEKTKIGYIDIQGGHLYRPEGTTNNSPYPCNFKVSVRYCNKDIAYNQLQDSDFSIIRTDTEDIDMSEGAVVSLDESKLGERFEARYLKLIVSTGDVPDIEEGPDNDTIKWYGAAIAGLTVYESDLITAEKYVNTDVINLYKDSKVYEQLYTQALVDSYAQAKLTEFQKNRTELTVSIPFGPHYEMGQTVYLNDIENNVARNYFIEEVSSSDGEINLTLAYYV